MDTRIEFLVGGGHRDSRQVFREYTHRRLASALRRFGHRVRHVTVRLVDQNGPRRGVDLRCSLIADLADGRRVFVEAIAAWPFAAVAAAASRLREALRRDGTRHAPRRGRTAHLTRAAVL
jgi:hypothetical protein